MRRVGWRPVGLSKVVSKVDTASDGSGWWREGNVKRVGSG